MIARVIGLDARPYGKVRTGVERYAAHIADAMAAADPTRELVFFSDAPLKVDLPGRLVVAPPVRLAKRSPVDLWLGRQLGPVLRREGVEVFYSTSSKFCLGFPASVTTVHGMEWWRCPEAYSHGQRLRQRIWMRLTLARAARIVCFADNTRADIDAYNGRPVEKVRVASEAAAAHFRRLADVPPDPTLGETPAFVVLGTLEPRKNVDGILRAYARACRATPALPPLAIVGKEALRSDRLTGIAAQEGIAERVNFLGFVDDARLVALLNRATALLYLSHYEGFGLPILEAMACGTPVVTSNVSSMPDVAGKAALFVDPTDEAAMAEAITRVATDDALSAALRRLGLAHAPGYSWARAAGEVLDILDEARGDG
ncbi:MAG: glycosyltransferase family 4 protein [Defluviimonas sp.]|uniref:glycosyltransferase family 4 protein n=1 Tax=Albidovulum sp. TaxID=1872424 RepID=UPI002A2DB7D5|nr:glycosyltransferase family 4 protein [Defluviimonas sp.]